MLMARVKMVGSVCAKSFLVHGLSEMDGLLGQLHHRKTKISIRSAKVIKCRVRSTQQHSKELYRNETEDQRDFFQYGADIFE
jgi:hypothetical protein